MSQFIRHMTMLLWAAMLWGVAGTGAGRAGELAEPTKRPRRQARMSGRKRND